MSTTEPNGEGSATAAEGNESEGVEPETTDATLAEPTPEESEAGIADAGITGDSAEVRVADAGETDAGESEATSAGTSEPTATEDAQGAPSEAAPHTKAPATGPSDRSATGIELERAVVGLMMVVSAVMVLWNLQDSSLKNANTGSRYATIESLVDHGTYSINESQYVFTIDKMKVGDDFISSKPPTLPTYGAGVYWLFQRITGFKISKNEGPVVWFVSLCTGWLAHVVFLIYLYRLSKLLMRRQLAIIGTVAAGGFAYLGVGYATAINNHSIAAALGVVGFYYAVRVRRGADAKVLHWVLSGLSFGVMTAVDLTSGAFMLAGFIYLASYDWRRTLLYFAPTLLPGVVLHQALNYSITGSMVPTYLNGDLKDFAENYFRHRRGGIDALKEPKYIYAFNVLLGHHGLFSMTPIYLFSGWELVAALKRRRALPEVLFVVGVVTTFLGFYIFRSTNYGGWCVGMRHLVPIMPMLVLAFGLWLERVQLNRWLWGAVLAAFAVSSFNVQDGLTSPFQFSVWHNWLEGKPNRGRVGKTWNVSKSPAKTKKKRPKPRPKPKSKSKSGN